MKYYKYQDDNGPLGKAVTYFEVSEGCAFKQLTIGSQEGQASNVNHPIWGMMLTDQEADYGALPDVTPIGKDEFDRVWNTHLASRSKEWAETKRRLPIGKEASGFVEVFYPHGVIVDLGDSALGVADYDACRASTTPEFMYPGYKVTAQVTAHDEENQWVVLGNPQIHAVRRGK
jgi:hypothetical protein